MPGATLALMRPQLLRLARKYADEWDLLSHVDDLEQEALIAVMHAIERHESPELFGIFAYRGMRTYAKRQWMRKHEALDEGTEASPAGDEWEDLQDQLDRLRTVPARERYTIIADAMGYTDAEIAERLGIPRRKVGCLAAKARRTLGLESAA